MKNVSPRCCRYRVKNQLELLAGALGDTERSMGVPPAAAATVPFGFPGSERLNGLWNHIYESYGRKFLAPNIESEKFKFMCMVY